ncbi:PTS sugar transporter subunit IIB [Enterococcus durans]|uniref:PTS sugar transporter subunit IIB n=1 Tax=Enterococcus durans TaxID=53345 RepID=UPI00288E6B10|nr:PTS sugar transporter subunit IIB [Enterococcus durans]MDT2836474.1 PTS sugar transporter subunit IIB [Enterococcus durans]
MKNILFICSGGMSSAIVEKALEKEAKKNNVELESSAVGSGEAEHAMKSSHWDMILVAPQVKHRFKLFKEVADEMKIPIELIPPRDYSPLGGKHLLELIQQTN